MVQFTPPPDYRNLLPPLLACLPTAFASPRPPPALLPLLSPILRQRVQLLSATTGTSSHSWLPLLCREPRSSDKAERLASILEGDAFELHPVSGEIEYRDVDINYRRLDEETLQARLVMTDLDLVVIYIWCERDQEGGGDGWRVSEVTPLDSKEDGSVSAAWRDSVQEADQKSGERIIAEALRQQKVAVQGLPVMKGLNGNDIRDIKEDDDDDYYWAQYDDTPAKTSATKRSPGTSVLPQVNGRARTTSEAEYFAQYSQVQPDMDNDDPSEDRTTFGKTSLNGNVMSSSISHAPPVNGISSEKSQKAINGTSDTVTECKIDQPRASSPTAVSVAVSRMEDSAELQSNAEIAIQQHVSTSIKSLFRLSRSTGMERQEFDRLVRTELDTLDMMELDD